MTSPVTLKCKFSEGFFDPILTEQQEKKILRTAGNKLAARLRRRLKSGAVSNRTHHQAAEAEKAKKLESDRRKNQRYFTKLRGGSKAPTSKAVKYNEGHLSISGQMIASIAFKLKKTANGVVLGTIAPRGVRKDADTHKSRAPMRNFSIAAFQAARGADTLQLDPAEEEWLLTEIQRLVDEEINKSATFFLR